MAQNTILILGAGPRAGWSVARKFKAEGYQVAVGSRNPDVKKATEENILTVTVDLTKTESVEDAFAHVKKSLGIPNVVVYNAATITFPEDFDDPFSISPQALMNDTKLNAFGAYVALREAVKGFKELSVGTPKAFIATGNVLPFKPHPAGVTLGAGKAALVHLVDIAAKAYRKGNFRFYFASQVTSSGDTIAYPDLSGGAHGLVYWELVNQTEQGAWDVRFLEDGRLVSSA
ncbi:epimerase/hydratase [Cadophora sp. DSE1049]|nr:epimerase/hydratase [Cadophora sp. DSE1049]